MHRRLSVLIVALFTLLAVSPAGASTLSAPQCFANVPGITNCIDGRFGSFWNGNGGLPVFGYPVTPQHDEVNADLQKTFSTQWFERNRFEQHPELAAPYDVLLGRLGAELLQVQSRDWHNEPNTGNPLGGTCRHFDATNRDVCGSFLTYWLGHGLQDPKLDAYGKSLALFGLPLTGVKSEKNPNGDTVMTQWFERARFELHPEVGNIVLLGLLGKERQGGGQVPPPPPAASGHTFMGTGQNVTDKFALSRGNYRVTSKHTGSSNFALLAYKPDGSKDLLVNTIGNYTGNRYLQIEQDGQVFLGITADGAWTITVDALNTDQSVAQGLSGHGDVVTGNFNPLSQGSVPYTFTHDGQSNFAVHLHCNDNDDLVQNEIGTVNNTAVAEFGQAPCFWEIEADGNWTISPK